MTQGNDARLDLRAVLGLALGAAAGAAAMYWLDPDSGVRRRTRTRQRTVRLGRKAQRFVGRATRDLAQRSRGVIAGARRSAPDADDVQIHERVRARLGHLCSHPRAVDVHVHGGVVTLSGPILAREAGPVVAECRKAPGVECVFDELERHDLAGSVPDLQGGAAPRATRWSRGFDAPGIQLLAGIAAGASIVTLLARRLVTAEPSSEWLGEGEENPTFYRHLATPPPMARSTAEE